MTTELTLTDRQQKFLEKVIEGKSVFLTGKAGTGKSFIVRHAIDILTQSGKKVIAVAPTGIAANNIDGQTIHSMFHITPFGVQSFETSNWLSGSNKKILKKVDAIFIDEISMLRPDILDAMNFAMIKNGLGPLYRKQIVFVGDLKQLPCVLSDNERSVLYETYDGDTFQFAKIYNKINPEMIELDEVLRQSNEEFIEHLNIVREGGRSAYFKQFVSKHPNGIILAPHNSTVKDYNETGLKNQKGDLFTFKATIEGDAKPQDFHLEEEVRVKNGCKIMYLINSKDNPLKNGTLGIFLSHSGCHYIRVGGVDYAIEPVSITKKKYVYDDESDKLKLKEVGSITQMPIKLAYALSIHKAQGLTFDEVTIDLKKPCFQKGQMYVALSRVRTPEGLRIII